MKKYQASVIIVLSLLACFTPLVAQQRAVLIEKFTNPYCGVCPNAAIEIEKLQATYPELIWVSHHKPVSWTEKHFANDASVQLRSDLGITGYPLGIVNRHRFGGALVTSLSQWPDRVEEATTAAVDTDGEVNISNVNFDTDSRMLTFDANVQFDEKPSMIIEDNIDRRVFAMIIEDSLRGVEQHNYFNETPGHPLEGRGAIIWDYYHRNVARTIIDEDVWGDNTMIPLDIDAGDRFTKGYSYVMPDNFKVEQIKIVVGYTLHDLSNTDNRNIKSVTQYQLKDNGLSSIAEPEDTASLILSVYPNPATDILYVKTAEKLTSLHILDNNGKVVSKPQVEEGHSGIALASLSEGVYFLLAEISGEMRARRFSVLR